MFLQTSIQVQEEGEKNIKMDVFIVLNSYVSPACEQYGSIIW